MCRTPLEASRSPETGVASDFETEPSPLQKQYVFLNPQPSSIHCSYLSSSSFAFQILLFPCCSISSSPKFPSCGCALFMKCRVNDKINHTLSFSTFLPSHIVLLQEYHNLISPRLNVMYSTLEQCCMLLKLLKTGFWEYGGLFCPNLQHVYYKCTPS